ncbi:conserved hypothetical protein [Leishmania mexicana MHOM/GT/2001/U1103]|uniref:Uncharacterized protein n=1 Tax=Leishmania mexicana (strain MHOM/GT/2001/U1103) TaxID=929439 RepID=E9ATD9_LEIMU|nr:conserved hypothetical protein [Leishmania mexicana MHOM/GT/2001/U1103]CBZ26213.1 conserved hypothetical protein [Leishmania mexicana MHOM/GT/2001/U1103]
MSVEKTFEKFCAMSALQQRRDGLLVPSETSHSFSYYQWLEVAKAKYAESQPPASSSQGQQRPPAKRAKAEDGVSDSGNALADGLAQQLAASLKSQTASANSPAALRHAAQEDFPMPQASADMLAFLALAEAAIRLTLWTPEDERLAQLAACLRPNLRTLEERRIIRFYYGCFPSLQVLMDLLSWRIIVHRWERLAPEMRQVAVDGVLTLCDCLDSVATEALRSAVQELPVSAVSSSSADTLELTTLDTLVRHASAAVPFQFATCRDLTPLYPEPVGVLHVPGAPAASSESVLRDEQQSQPADEKRVDDDAEVQLGELLGVTCTPTRTVCASAEEESPTRRTQAAPVVAPPFRSILKTAQRTSGGARPFTGVTQTRHGIPMRTASGHIACMSQYHARYADPAKHASSECPYCATCHLMEIIFRGNKRNCVWAHWPTPRKIRLHLKQFPKVMKLAQERFAAMQRGVQLAATDELPL